MSQRKLIYLLLIFSPFLLVLPLTIYFLRFPQAPERGRAVAEVLFQDNFEADSLNWQGHTGGWRWEANAGENGGGYRYVWASNLEEDSFAILKNKNFTDFSIEAKIKVNSGNAGIGARMTVSNMADSLPRVGGYILVLAPDKLRLRRYRLFQPSGLIGDHRNPLLLAEKNFSRQNGQWYQLKMEFSGNKIRCFVNNVLEIDYSDTNSLTGDEISHSETQNGAIFKNGTVGFISYKADAAWDNVVVRSLGGGEAATPTQGLSTQPCHKVTIEGSNNFYCQGSCSSGKTCQQVGQDCQCISGQGGGGRCMVLDDYQDERHGICCLQSQCLNAAGQLKRLPGDSANTNGCGTVSGQESIWCCSYCNGTPAPTPIGGYPTKRPEVQATSTPPPATATATTIPTATPTTQENIPYLIFLVRFEGFPESRQPKMAVTLKIKETDFVKTLMIAGNSRTTEPINLTNFVPGKTYEFVISAWGYLSAKKSLVLNSGHSEANQIDLGTLKVGDLNGDNQINGIDWSLMKLHFGESGDGNSIGVIFAVGLARGWGNCKVSSPVAGLAVDFGTKTLTSSNSFWTFK